MSSLPSKPSQKNGLLFKLKAKLLACFGDTTAHGYGRVANADSRPLVLDFGLCSRSRSFFSAALWYNKTIHVKASKS